MPNNKNKTFDLAILGTGLASTMLGAIMAQHGLEVLMIDKKNHPRFAIGESTVPNTTLLMKLMAKRFSVPEIGHLGDFYSVIDKVGASSGIKRGFSFFHHQEGQMPDPKQSVQLPTLTPPFGPDMHYFRQDTDGYMLSAAARYGAIIQQNTAISEIEMTEHGVRLQTTDGQSYTARYLVDGAGYQSPLAHQLKLRESPPRYKTNTRTLFTHMINVKNYDCIVPQEAHGLPYPISQTTLHHLFDGGWLWVIPFNNHRYSTNHLCSVGLTLDNERYPNSSLPAEEEFKQFLQNYPSIAQQFDEAQAIRSWVKTGRIQYSSSQVIGPRWALLPHAAGFIDPFFSAGLTVTCIGVSKLADLLIDAYASNSFSTEKFAEYETLIQQNIVHQDRMVANAYASFSEGFDLWNSWFRVWCLGSILAGAGLIRLYCRYLETKEPSFLAAINEPAYNVLFSHHLKEFSELFDAAENQVTAARTGTLSKELAANNIFRLLDEADFAPSYLKLAEPKNREITTFTVQSAWKLPVSFRLGYKGPKEFRSYYSDYHLHTIMLATIKSWLSNTSPSMSRSWSILKDLLWTWNDDWQHSST